MWEWLNSRPQRCLKFGIDSIAWAETEWNWRGHRRHRCIISALPNGMVKPSPTVENLSQLPELAKRILSITGSGSEDNITGASTLAGPPRRITVMLPDTAVRATVLYLEQLPARREDREALIRWRLGQEQLFPLNGAKIMSHVFHNQWCGSERAFTVLTVAIQESVLRQYEALCESVGLIPHDVGITSLRLFNLWRRTSGRSDWRHRDVFWVSISDQALTTMVCQRGRLLFYRCKLLGTKADGALAATSMLNKILEECGASLAFYRQHYSSAIIKEAVICADDDMPILQERMQAELLLSVEQLGWESVEALGKVAKGSHGGMASLAAMAGVA
ncbi:MAG: hypothetical protein OJF51_003824 [Nitrospira sp.]|nr:MAG: hypothetical protein OJF51_003824 [Nitrospira sp.]